MSRNFSRFFKTALTTGVAAAALCSVASAKSHTPKKTSPEVVLYDFQGSTSGGHPNSNLIADQTGNLYGVTSFGGDMSCGQAAPRERRGSTPPKKPPAGGCGVIFKLASNGTESVLHAFAGQPADGQGPNGYLTADSSGNLYGTTYAGGSPNCLGGCGTVFEVTSGGAYSNFLLQGESTGFYPSSGLVVDAQGNLYGTASGGTMCGNQYCGVIFELTPNGTYSVLYSFTGQPDGNNPSGSLAIDSSGNIYGTTISGGTANDGAVFEYTPGGTESVLYSFLGGADGTGTAGLSIDSRGNLYGFTEVGTGCGGTGCGAIFKLAPGGAKTLLYTFQGGADGGLPSGTPVLDSSGNLYGTGVFNAGTVYEVTPSGTETTLLQFVKKKHGGYGPLGGVILDQSGNLYGTTSAGGTKVSWPGVVFKLTR